MDNRVFFPQLAIDQWGIEGKIDLTGSELIVLAEGRRFKIVEAVRVVAEVSGANDPHGIVGKVKAMSVLVELKAEILEGSMILGDNAYDVVPGWMGTPTTPFSDHRRSEDRVKARGSKTDDGSVPSTDEEMLARFANGTL